MQLLRLEEARANIETIEGARRLQSKQENISKVLEKWQGNGAHAAHVQTASEQKNNSSKQKWDGSHNQTAAKTQNKDVRGPSTRAWRLNENIETAYAHAERGIISHQKEAAAESWQSISRVSP